MAVGVVTAATRDGDRFVVALLDGLVVRARRLLIATGLLDELPDLPGLRELWCRDVLHCPYCHGWEDPGHRRAGYRTSGDAPGIAVPPVERRRRLLQPHCTAERG